MLIVNLPRVAHSPLFADFFLGWVGLGLGSSSVSKYYLYAVFQTNIILVNRRHYRVAFCVFDRPRLALYQVEVIGLKRTIFVLTAQCSRDI